jgi:hypothetical protein
MALSLKSHGIGQIPFIWFWPDKFSACVLMTHDVETRVGRDFCQELMDLDDGAGIKSAFEVVPEGRYPVPESYLDSIRGRGFEVNIHDLNHDGRLFTDKERFLSRAARINEYGRQFGAEGFRSAVLYRNPEWLGALDFAYDMSLPNSAHLDPQPGGCCTVMPYFIGKILELPVTTIQDYSLFNILGDYSLDLWKKQTGLIIEKHGLASFIIHPDYIRAEKARQSYIQLLNYLSELRSKHGVWTAQPRDVNEWWRLRSKMKLVQENGRWQIEGEGKERAQVAYATLADDSVRYSFECEACPAFA